MRQKEMLKHLGYKSETRQRGNHKVQNAAAAGYEKVMTTSSTGNSSGILHKAKDEKIEY